MCIFRTLDLSFIFYILCSCKELVSIVLIIRKNEFLSEVLHCNRTLQLMLEFGSLSAFFLVCSFYFTCYSWTFSLPYAPGTSCPDRYCFVCCQCYTWFGKIPTFQERGIVLHFCFSVSI